MARVVLALMVVVCLGLPVLMGGCVGGLGDGEELARHSEEMDSVRPLFDLATLRCPDLESSCPVPSPLDDKGRPKCFCVDDFAHQNYVVELGDGVRGHYLAVGNDTLRDAILAVGNRPAFYVDAMNESWDTLGAQGKAQAMFDAAFAKFDGKVPTWFVLNEISKSQWKTNATYRGYVVKLAKRLKEHHGRKVLVLSPFSAPGAASQGFASSWSALAQHAFVGVENYLSGAEIAGAGFSEAWCREQYQRSITWYGKMGVPAGRLVLVEHFGHTPAGEQWGRAGLQHADWIEAIHVRSRAARSLPFFGFASYGWASNHMNALNARRQAAQDAYHRAIEGEPISVSPVELPTDAVPDPDPPAEEDPEPEDPPQGDPPPPATGSDVLAPGATLAPGAWITSNDGRFTFVYQNDGNLVLYQGSSYLWASNTQNTVPGVTVMQHDGNLVVYDGDGVPRWASWTQGHAGAQLIVQNDGNVVVYSASWEPLWATNTCCQ